MPFKRVGKNDYVSPSGKHWTAQQVKAYYATDGFTRKTHKSSSHKKRKK